MRHIQLLKGKLMFPANFTVDLIRPLVCYNYLD